jgi:hypothetical protein
MRPIKSYQISATRYRIASIAALLYYLYRILFGTVTGVFLISIGIYQTADTIFGIKVWDLATLALWFDNLDKETRTAIATSLITVLGFFIALHTTMAAWRKQTETALRLTAGEQIDVALVDLNRTLLDIQIYSQATADELKRISEQKHQPTLAVKLTPLAEDAALFAENRTRALNQISEVGRMASKYAILFLPVPGAKEALDELDDDLDTIRSAIWVHVPILDTSKPGHREEFFNRVEQSAMRDLGEVCCAAQDAVIKVQNVVKGGIITPIFELNMTAVLKLLRGAFAKQDE